MILVVTPKIKSAIIWGTNRTRMRRRKKRSNVGCFSASLGVSSCVANPACSAGELGCIFTLGRHFEMNLEYGMNVVQSVY